MRRGGGRGRGAAPRGSVHLRYRPPRPAPYPAVSERAGPSRGQPAWSDLKPAYSAKPMGFMQLNELTDKDPAEVVTALASSRRRKFQSTLAAELQDDAVVLLVRCLRKVCAADFGHSKTEILTGACRSAFAKRLLDYVFELPRAKIADERHNWLFWSEPEAFWADLLELYRTVVDLSPTTAHECLRQLVDATKAAFEGLLARREETPPEELVAEFDAVQLKMAAIAEEMEAKTASKRAKLNERRLVGEGVEVPDDFRAMSVIPRGEELRRDARAFLRPNVVDGEYASADHYLDVQFRLMREDYVRPMREAIVAFRRNPDERRYGGGRFYKNVRFSHFAATTNSVGVVVKLDTRRRRNPKAFFRRFMFGALLCFTDDNFGTVFFGTIVNREDEDLLQGKIVVDLIDFHFNDEMFKKTFTMFESDVFYLQYGPVLEILQNFRGALPMEKYIVKMQSSSEPPPYILNNPNLEAAILQEIDRLDEYQYGAFRHALTRDFVTIQGPPGTGKTYLGLKIVSTILKHVADENFPILILCYTNHALDQFLEGLLETTQEIVRIGGQSKNEELATKYNLAKLRRTIHMPNPHLGELKDVMNEVLSLQKLYEEVDNQSSITDVNLIKLVVPNFERYESSLEEFAMHYRERSWFVNWLMMSDNIHELLTRKNKINDNRIPLENTVDDGDAKDLEALSKAIRNPRRLDTFGDDDIDDEIDDDIDVKTVDYVFQHFYVHSLHDELTNVESMLSDRTLSRQNANVLNNTHYRLTSEIAFLQDMLSQVDQDQILDLTEIDLRYTSAEERWKIYHLWNAETKLSILRKMERLHKRYRTIVTLHEEVNMMRDLQILKDAKVVGVTTTGAARLRPLLTSLSPKIVIVEEAAEVLESHIVVNLSNKCQHLILIGDHQQLRPSTASYRLGKKFNLEISLFERMFINDKNCYRLAVQHRMRPEISKLITPSIYSVLHDHESVEEFPSVKGVAKNVYFINHSNPEEMDEDINSYRNVHEAQFMVSLCKYLIQQGYQPKDITMIMPYSGQLFCIQKIRREEEKPIQDVRVSILDNFQGEENKIILLSLVRSNDADKIGFLNTANRICVALSRAKEGFFIIGNMDIMTKASDLWQTINVTLKEQDSVGVALPLQCQNHRTISEVKSSHDFVSLVPEGGCQLQCNTLLNCTHICQSVCHIVLNDHADYKCKAKCDRECELNHKCPLLCYEECRCKVIVKKALKPCGHSKSVACHENPEEVQCFLPVEVTLTRCDHKLCISHPVTVKCFETRVKKNDNLPCPEACIDRLPCGHACKKKCHKNVDPQHLHYRCFEKCTENNRDCKQEHKCQKLCHQECDLCVFWVVKKRTTCGHTEKAMCHVDLDATPCHTNCRRVLPCGHFCKKKCSEPCGDCKTKIKKTRSCGHDVTADCGGNADDVPCQERCSLNLTCGHRCRDLCGKPCGVWKCNDSVPNPFPSICGHRFDIPCHYAVNEPENSKLVLAEYCKERCNTILQDCKHACIGTCGACRGRIHAPCGAPCGNRLICGHICKDPCREGCSSCLMPCEVECFHSKCPRKCGVPCAPCKMPCTRRCPHLKCMKKCGDLCNIGPCVKPCTKKLICGHECISLCGAPCPDICRLCDPDKLPEDIFLVDYDETTRFVLLVDCGHHVEVKCMDRSVEVTRENNEIAYPTCPYCKTSVINTPKYADVAKVIFNDIQAAKKQSYGDKNENMLRTQQLGEDIQALSQKNIARLFAGAPLWKVILGKIWKEYAQKCQQIVQRSNKRMVIIFNKTDIERFCSIVTIMKELSKMPFKKEYLTDTTLQQFNFILRGVDKCGRKFSQQMADDFNRELLRMRYILKLDEVETMSVPSSEKDLMSLKEILLFTNLPFVKDIQERVDSLLIKRVNIEKIVRAERVMIVKAMGFRQGHWYKCPKGHIYCIADCGGANGTGICPECGCTIGGQNHQLAIGNALAPEMDGASHSAYSEAATQEYLLREGLIPIH